jgi:hypothetical protein
MRDSGRISQQPFPYKEAVKEMTRSEKLRVASKIPGLALV